jgi:hypothetical protein
MQLRTPTSVSLLAAALALSLAAPIAARADTVTVTFDITSTVGSSNKFYALGSVGTGSFSFDSSVMPAGGTGLVGNGILGTPTLALSFDWFGTHFDIANASISTLSFSNGQLTDWSLGGRYTPPICGLMRYTCLHSAGTQPDFMLSTTGGSMNDGVNAGTGSGYGTVHWSVSSVPEPSALATMALGMLGLALRRRSAIRR